MFIGALIFYDYDFGDYEKKNKPIWSSRACIQSELFVSESARISYFLVGVQI